MDEAERNEIRRRFDAAVNMAPAELEDWLETDESRKVGWKKDGAESVGHASGRRLLRILRMAETALGDEDYVDMRKVAAMSRGTGRGGRRIPSRRAGATA